MSTLDELKAAVKELREIRRNPGRGRALYDLNIWKGEQRRALDLEYQRRLAEIEAAPEPKIEDEVSPQILGLVGQAVMEGVSRSNIRIALGKASLAEADEIIELSRGKFREAVAAGAVEAFSIAETGETHGRGWPMYEVTLLATGEKFASVYLITSPNTQAVDRRHLRIHPAPAGSSETLDLIWESGAAQAIFERGQA
jgi:hypothetical protein